MSLFSKAKEAAREFADGFQAEAGKPQQRSAAEQDRIRREGERAVLNNQQQGLTD